MLHSISLEYLILFILVTHGAILLWITSKIHFIYKRNQSMFEIRIGDELPIKAVKHLKAANVFKGTAPELVFILFIETNCSVCKGVLKTLSADGRNLENLLLINGNEKDQDDHIIKMVEDTPLIYVKNERVIQAMNIKSVPQIMLVDPNYKVIYRDVIPDGERLKMIMRDFSNMYGKVREA